MPRVGGIEATRRITHHSPHISILVLSMFEGDDSLFAALQAGACGYLLKGALKGEILRAIRAVVVRTLTFVILRRILGVVGCGRTPDANEVEIAVLRHQLAVLRRNTGSVVAA